MTKTRGHRPYVDVDSVRLSGFCLVDAMPATNSPWHAHRKHQLLALTQGALKLETDGAQWLVTPHRAAFIRAGVSHRVLANTPVSLCTTYFAPGLLASSALPRCSVFALSPFGRELVTYAARWSPERSAHDVTANAFFGLLSHFVKEWAPQGLSVHLPVARSLELEKAMQWMADQVEEQLTLSQVAHVAAMSPRTLARRFEEETQMGFRSYLQRLRVHTGMELLSRHQARVGEVALACGFTSIAAFTHAFKSVTGERPTDFRKRVRTEGLLTSK